METRFKVITYALEIETRISNLLSICFKLFQPGSNTISYKSSSLSTKNKIDLLLDFGELNNADYEMFYIFFEIRSLFVHNLSCKTFSDIQDLNLPLFKNLMKFGGATLTQTEGEYHDTFENVYRTCTNKLTTLIDRYSVNHVHEPKKTIVLEISQEQKSIIADAKLFWKEEFAPKNEPELSLSIMSIENFISCLETILKERNSYWTNYLAKNKEEVLQNKEDLRKTIQDLITLDEVNFGHGDYLI